MSLPQSLPKLLQAMRWNDRENVAQVSAFFNRIHIQTYMTCLQWWLSNARVRVCAFSKWVDRKLGSNDEICVKRAELICGVAQSCSDSSQ